MFCFDRDAVTVRLYHEPVGAVGAKPIYVRLALSERRHDKSRHKAIWAFALSAAVTKVGDSSIEELCREIGYRGHKRTGIWLRQVQGLTRFDHVRTVRRPLKQFLQDLIVPLKRKRIDGVQVGQK
jgi:hypothetical protein